MHKQHELLFNIDFGWLQWSLMRILQASHLAAVASLLLYVIVFVMNGHLHLTVVLVTRWKAGFQ